MVLKEEEGVTLGQEEFFMVPTAHSMSVVAPFDPNLAGRELPIVQPGEERVGVLKDDLLDSWARLQRGLIYIKYFAEETKTAIGDAQRTGNPVFVETARVMIGTYNAISASAKLFGSMLERKIRLSFRIPPDVQVAIRQELQVVTHHEELKPGDEMVKSEDLNLETLPV